MHYGRSQYPFTSLSLYFQPLLCGELPDKSGEGFLVLKLLVEPSKLMDPLGDLNGALCIANRPRHRITAGEPSLSVTLRL